MLQRTASPYCGRHKNRHWTCLRQGHSLKNRLTVSEASRKVRSSQRSRSQRAHLGGCSSAVWLYDMVHTLRQNACRIKTDEILPLKTFRMNMISCCDLLAETDVSLKCLSRSAYAYGDRVQSTGHVNHVICPPPPKKKLPKSFFFQKWIRVHPKNSGLNPWSFQFWGYPRLRPRSKLALLKPVTGSASVSDFYIFSSDFDNILEFGRKI